MFLFNKKKKAEFRKRKDSEKEIKIKERQERAKKFKEEMKSFQLSIVMFLLIGANLIFLISVAIHSFATSDATAPVATTNYSITNIQDIPKTLKVEVLNGCGIDGLAKTLTSYLREKNIDVVYFGDFESWLLSETLVIDRRDPKLANAKVIGKLIGVKENRMFPQLSPQRQLDVSIIIGKNYSELRAFQ